jgi:precorrin-8X/cobalt-precorrin-8 methylmutase
MITLQHVKPLQIETESFRIIEHEFPEQTGHHPDEYGPDRFKVIQRVIHATGDFSFAANLIFHERAIQSGLASIRAGRNILIDVNMGAAGISRSILQKFGGEVVCRIGDKDVAQIAKNKGLTRSEAAFDLAAGDNIGIVAIGNAPTALLAAMRLIEEEKFSPDLVIGVPVGFVNAQESKEILSEKTYPFITALGRKGGSSVAVAIINALLRLAETVE